MLSFLIHNSYLTMKYSIFIHLIIIVGVMLIIPYVKALIFKILIFIIQIEDFIH